MCANSEFARSMLIWELREASCKVQFVTGEQTRICLQENYQGVNENDSTVTN